MKCFLGLAFLCVVAHASVTSLSPVPLFMWSGKQYFAEHAVTGDVINTGDFSNTLSQIVNGGSEESTLGQYLTNTQAKPEAIIAFVHNQMGSTGASAYTGAYSSTPSALEDIVSNSLSSLAAPYLLAESSTITQALTQEFTSPALTFTLGQAGSCDSLMDKLQGDTSLFSNQESSLILVNVEDDSNEAECMKRVCSYVDSQTDGSYLALLSADSSDSELHMGFKRDLEPQAFVEASFQPAKHNLIEVQALGDTTEYVWPGPRYITSTILLAIMLAVFLLYMLYIAVGCLMSIETPPRFSHTRLKLTKDY